MKSCRLGFLLIHNNPVQILIYMQSESNAAPDSRTKIRPAAETNPGLNLELARMSILHSYPQVLVDNCKTDIPVCPETATTLIMEQFPIGIAVRRAKVLTFYHKRVKLCT